MIRSRFASYLNLFALCLAFVGLTGTVAVAQEADQPKDAEASIGALTTPTADKPAAIPDLIATQDFAARVKFWNAQLSPSGHQLTLLQSAGKKLQLTVMDPRTRELINAINFEEGSRVGWYRWIDDKRMLVNVTGYAVAYGVLVPTNILYLVYPDEGRGTRLIDEQKGFAGGELIHVAKDKKSVLIAHPPPDASRYGTRGFRRVFFNFEPGIYRYSLEPGGAMAPVLEPKKGVDAWIPDDDGIVRLGLGWRRKRLSIYYRDTPDGEFERVARVKRGDTEGFFDAIQLIGGSSQGYVLEENDEGRVGLRLYDYATRSVVSTFYEHPEWDVDDVWFNQDGTPLAAFYTDDRERAVWFDEEYKATHERLSKALGQNSIWIVSRSENGRQMLVSAQNEADPGVLYFYDADTKKLSEFAQYRPEIDFRSLATPKPVSYTARDGTKIRAYLTLPKGREPKDLPLIVHPHGGPFGFRDELRYNDEVQFLANRGYAVLQPNFRGSGGYGTAFYELGEGEVGRGMQDDLDDAMDWAVAQGLADPARVCIVGSSYGGYAALWGVLRNPERYACAASWAGVTDWTKMLKYDRRTMTRQAGKRWSAKVEGDDEDVDLKDYSPYRLAKGLSRPVLLAHGTRDDNVPFAQYEIMEKATRKAPVPLETLVIEGEGHSFSRKNSEEKWYDALDAFLAKHNPADKAHDVSEAALIKAEAKAQEDKKVEP